MTDLGNVLNHCLSLILWVVQLGLLCRRANCLDPRGQGGQTA